MSPCFFFYLMQNCLIEFSDVPPTGVLREHEQYIDKYVNIYAYNITGWQHKRMRAHESSAVKAKVFNSWNSTVLWHNNQNHFHHRSASVLLYSVLTLKSRIEIRFQYTSFCPFTTARPNFNFLRFCPFWLPLYYIDVMPYYESDFITLSSVLCFNWAPGFI